MLSCSSLSPFEVQLRSLSILSLVGLDCPSTDRIWDIHIRVSDVRGSHHGRTTYISSLSLSPIPVCYQSVPQVVIRDLDIISICHLQSCVEVVLVLIESASAITLDTECVPVLTDGFCASALIEEPPDVETIFRKVLTSTERTWFQFGHPFILSTQKCLKHIIQTYSFTNTPDTTLVLTSAV